MLPKKLVVVVARKLIRWNHVVQRLEKFDGDDASSRLSEAYFTRELSTAELSTRRGNVNVAREKVRTQRRSTSRDRQ